LYQHIHAGASEQTLILASVLPMFPLLSFFGNLYYTDVLSTTLVLYCYLLALQRRFISSSMVGAFSTLTRQTNIIWVAFIMAVSMVRELKEADVVELDKEENSPIQRAWLMFDPLAADARFPVDYIVAVRQTMFSVIGHLDIVLPIVSCYGSIFLGFILFLLWNNGIVLGDRNNHVAGINIPQLFYCATFITAFGAPILFWQGMVSKFVYSSFSSVRNVIKTLLILSFLLLVVHQNTIEHPFLLSDNRHFVFYIWRRTIKRHSLGRYLAVPIYYGSTWIVLTALSYSQSALFIVGLVACTGLTLIPSPLLEFRYFVVPYLLWRLHLSPSFVERSKWRGVLELAWYELVNLITVGIFISKPFTWESEPDKTQRFIW